MRRPRLALAALAVVSIAGGAIARGVAREHASIEPFPVVDAWGRGGALVVLALSVVCAVAYLALRAAVVHPARTRAGSADGEARGSARLDRTERVLVGALAAVSALAIFAGWGCSLSADVYAYAAYGEIARSGADPARALGPSDPLLADPLVAAALVHWPDGLPPCVYGPGFVFAARMAVTGAVVVAGGPTSAALSFAIDLLRMLALLSLAALATALALLARGRSDSAIVVAAVVLHPLVLWGALEGHNDAAALALAVGAVVLARDAPSLRDARAARAAAVTGAVAAALAGLIKATGAAALPVVVAGLWSGRGGRLREAALAGAVLGTALLAYGLVALWPALSHLSSHSTYHPSYSLQGVLVGAASVCGLLDTGSARIAGVAVSLALCALLAVKGGGRLARAAAGVKPGDRRAQGRTLLGIAAFAGLPNPQPWYGAWFAALAAVSLVRADGSLAPAALGLWAATFSLAVRYLPDAAGPLAPRGHVLVSIVPLLPIAAGLLAEYGLPAARRRARTKADS